MADNTYRVSYRTRHIVYSLTKLPQSKSNLRQELVSHALDFVDLLRWPRREHIGHIIERITNHSSKTTSTRTTVITTASTTRSTGSSSGSRLSSSSYSGTTNHLLSTSGSRLELVVVVSMVVIIAASENAQMLNPTPTHQTSVRMMARRRQAVDY